jgi:hypothetical protein
MTPEPVQVHVVADSTKPAATAPATRRRTVPRTIVLTANDPVQVILPDSDRRRCAYILPIDNPIVLGHSQGEAGAAANTAANTPFPSGAYLPAPSATTPAVPWVIDDQGPVWAGVTTTASNSRITVIAVYRRRHRAPHPGRPERALAADPRQRQGLQQHQ